jgi:prepilin peptidase CpaA
MTSHLLIHTISILAFGALLVAAAIEDVRGLTIPNRIPLGIIILYPAYVLSAGAPVDWTGAAVLAAIALVIGFVIFARGYAGGGDAKLFVAASLWAGPTLFPTFLVVTAIVGGAIAIGMIAHRRFARAMQARADQSAAGTAPEGADGWLSVNPVTRIYAALASVGARRDLPYGVAIAAGGIQVVVHLLVGV